MTAAVPSAPPTAPVRPADRRRMRRQVMRAGVRILVVTGTVVGVFVSAPLEQRPLGSIAVRLLVGLVALVLVLGWQVRSVLRSPNPTLRGVESIAVSVPLLVLTFAAAYYATERASTGSFTESLTRLDAAYFAVTVLTTVGFGDIAPHSEAARSMVMSQMIVDLAFVGLVVKVLVGAVRRRRDEMQNVAAPSSPGEVEAT
jgi:flagellar biogenesis protein FliO